MTPLEMIAEWRKGCSNSMEADGVQWRHPERCPHCTRALIDALEARLTVDAAKAEK
jgi:PP-loop superfamily ATP-utilizing enzyme